MNKKIFAILFLILMMNGVFASSIDPNRTTNKDTLYFQDPYSSYSYNQGCYTETLPPEAVERIWKDILVKGFIVNDITSNQPANFQRETLENNEVIVTGEDTKADDVVAKIELPNQIIDPLEVPSILGQVCYGPFTHGLDLDSTLRVGRCAGGDDFACYLENEGLFRQNGKYGFFPQTFSVATDFLDMLGAKKLQEVTNEVIDPDLDYNTSVDLGLFSEMSYEELAMFRKYSYSDQNVTDVEVQKFSLILDKGIKNSIITNTFNASMESTCNSENCYINMYSLFDKVFNQYYSADMVFTSVSPILYKYTGKIFRGVSKNLVDVKSKNVIIGKNGFLDNFVNGKQSPIKAIRSTYKIRQISKNMDTYISQLGKSNDRIIQNINKFDMKPQWDKYLESLNSKKNIDSITNEFFKTGEFTKLNKAQQRVFMESVMDFQDNIKIGRMIQDSSSASITASGVNLNSMKQILSDKTKTLDDFYGSLTKEQYDILNTEILRANKLNQEFSNFASKKFKWDDGISDIPYLKERIKIVGGKEININKIKLNAESGATTINTSKDLSDVIAKGDVSKYNTQTIWVNFADGPQQVKVIVPFKETIGATATPIPTIGQLDAFRQPNLLIEYTSTGGAAKQIRGTLVDVSDINPAQPIRYRTLTEELVTNPVEIRQLSIDPLEASFGYFDTLGVKKLKDAEAVSNSVMRVLSDQGWTTGRGLSYVNQRMKQQNITQWDKRAIDIMSDSGKAWWFNFAYWQIKTAGATMPVIGGAFDRYAMIRIPETYTSVIFKHGENEDIYNDAYIDFFANDGSDQGDLFMQYFNSILFWMANLPKLALENTEWETTQGFSNWVKDFTEGKIRRSFTDNIVLYTDSLNNNCNTDSCQIKIGDTSLLEEVTRKKSIDTNQTINLNNKNISLSYVTSSGIITKGYILENTSKANLEKYGQTLISFSHHTDYDGSIAGFKTTDSVNLVNEIKNENTCSDKLKNLEVMGVPIGFTNTWTGKSYRTGAVAAGFSNLVYYGLSVPHHRVAMGMIFGDLVPQMIIVPEIYNCTDHEEGYYTHFFVAKEEYERIEKDPKNKVGDAISKGADSVEKTLTGVTKNTELQESIKQTTDEVKQFAETKIKDNPIMQSRIETKGNTSASFDARLFFLELGEGTTCRASGYNDKGVEHLIDSKLKETLIIDKEKGDMTIVDEDGNIKEIIGSENKDWIRLIATNLGIPAKVIPHSISYIPLPDTDTPLFNIDVFGNLKVEDIDFLNCLKQNYFEQTGLEMNGNLLTEYLGSVKQVTSTNQINPETQYDIVPKGRQNVYEIIAEGNPRRIAKGEASKITVLGDRTTKIFPIEGNEVTLGKNIAIQFERGQLIYNGEKNSYIMWVEQTYIMHQSEIKGMDVKPVKETNEVTGCEEDAFEISIQPDTDNPEAVKKSEEMNKALQKVGPFQMFDTPSKTFIFYTGDPPECEQRMKIIDKKTGQVTDLAVDSITPTPDGFIVKTEDGAEHTFGFSAEDGVPKLKYNDLTETLLSAQGKNGAFWYDPKTGNWYTENGHLIPLNPDYRDGMTFKIGEDGKAHATTIQNLMNPFAGSGSGDRGALNIPLSPEKALPFTLYVLIIIGCFMYLFTKKENLKNKRK
jgi:hypothetical protein